MIIRRRLPDTFINWKTKKSGTMEGWLFSEQAASVESDHLVSLDQFGESAMFFQAKAWLPQWHIKVIPMTVDLYTTEVRAASFESAQVCSVSEIATACLRIIPRFCQRHYDPKSGRLPDRRCD